jgi:DNA adenine methylase
MADNKFLGQNKSMLTWMGNKSSIADFIVGLMPKHDIYIEPFFGSGAVLFTKKPAKLEIVNDVNDLLVNFWNVIKEDMGGFLAKFDLALYSRTTFDEYRNTDWKALDRVEKAFRFYYLVRNAWCRLYRVNSSGKFNAPFAGAANSSLLKGDRNLARQFFDTRQLIAAAHARLERVCIENLDYKEVIKKYEGNNILYFFDPPYTTNYQYCTDFNMAEFMDVLKSIKGKFILTLNAELKDKFKDYNIVDLNPTAKMNSTNPDIKFSQILVTNFTPGENPDRKDGWRQEPLF